VGGHTGRVLRRSDHDQPGTGGQAVPERVEIDAVAVLESRGHRDDPGAETAQGIEHGRKARHPHEDFSVAMQQPDQEQRRGRTGGEQDLLIGDPEPRRDQGTQVRVAGRRPVPEAQASHLGRVEDVRDRKVRCVALAQVVLR